ncbi:MAG: hypothetical protein WC325_13700 [Candidatus Bathyarchaeia archaeon]
MASETVWKCCGNCDSHNTYDYPAKLFCSTRYCQHKDPIVDTLWQCEKWNLVSQECHCIREALKAKNLNQNGSR